MKKDSVPEGYWLKDVYAGLQETTYMLFYKSKLVNEPDVEFKQGSDNKITFSSPIPPAVVFLLMELK